MTAVDVGGNIGYVALLMAECVGPSGHVVAVEPDPRNAHVLRANAERTRGARIEVVEAAAWSEPGMLDLGLHATNSGDHRVGSPPKSARQSRCRRCGSTTSCRTGST